MIHSVTDLHKPPCVPNGTPLVEYVASAIMRSRASKTLSRIVVVVPSLYSAFFLRRAVTAKLCDDQGFFNVEFMRIEEVADVLYDATDQQDMPSMTRLIASELIHNAISNINTPGPLTRHADNDSTLDAAQRTLQELELLDGGADAALAQLSRVSNDGLYAQLLELQRKYTALASSYMTREMKASIAAQTVSSDAERVDSIIGADIIVVRAPSPPDAYTRLWDALERLDSSIVVRVEPGDGTNDGIVDNSAKTRFYSSSSAADEPRALIRNLMADARARVRFGEMAVLYPTTDYSSRIKDALDGAGIRNCGPSTKTLGEMPSGKFVSLFLSMVNTDMRRDAFTAWTTSSPVVSPTDGSRVPAVMWEIVSRNAQIPSFAEAGNWYRMLRSFEFRMNRRADRAVTADTESTPINPSSYRNAAIAGAGLRRFVAELTNRIDVDEPRSWAEWADWFDGILADYHVQTDGFDSGDRTGFARVGAEIDQVRDLSSVTSTRIDFARFARTVQRILRARIGGDSGWGSSVLVAPLSASIGTAFRSVHIVGMSEGGLPSIGRSDPLLSDEMRLRLDPDSHWLATKRDVLEHQRREFDLALASAPSRRLYWNKAILGATNESYPSPWFIGEISKSNGQANVPIKSLMDPAAEWVESATVLSDIGTSGFEASSDYEFALQNAAIGSRDESTKKEFLEEPGKQVLKRGKHTLRSRVSGEFGRHDGNIPKHLINASAPLDFSAGVLQNYAECPYRYFLSKELNAEERIDPEELLKLSALDEGRLLHSILERFFARFGVDASEEGRENLTQVAMELCDEFLRDEYTGSRAIFEIARRDLIRRLKHWHQKNLDVLRGYDGELITEFRFGFEDDLGIYMLRDGTPIHFRGMIDLIAISKSGESALVLDFKSGNSGSFSKIDKDVTDSGTKLQLPIYSLVAREILGDYADISAAYWFVYHDTGIRLRPKSRVGFDAAQEQFDPVIETIVDGIREGNFPARPGDRDSHGDGPAWKNCKYCAYSDTCATDRQAQWNWKKSAPELAGYVLLAEGDSA